MCLELRRDLDIGLRAGTGVGNNFNFAFKFLKRISFWEYATELTKVNAQKI